MPEQFTLCWSKRQNAFHVETMAELLARNRCAYREDEAISDYHVIHVGNYDECKAAAAACRNTIAERHKEAA